MWRLMTYVNKAKVCGLNKAVALEKKKRKKEKKNERSDQMIKTYDSKEQQTRRENSWRLTNSWKNQEVRGDEIHQKI